MSKKRRENDKEAKLNRRLRNSFIIFLISGILALVIILNKGVIFGKRLVAVTDTSAAPEVHTIQLVPASNFIKKDGDKTELMVSIDGADRTDGFELTSSDEDVVKIEFNEEESKYYAVSINPGTSVVTAKSPDYGIEYQATIDVVEPITKLTLSSEEKTISVCQETTMQYSCKPQTSDVKVNISYKSSDESIATVNESGIVTGVSKGTVTITGKDEITGIEATYKVKVN